MLVKELLYTLLLAVVPIALTSDKQSTCDGILPYPATTMTLKLTWIFYIGGRANLK